MLTDYEYRYKIVGGSFVSPIGCTISNSIDNGDGTITITAVPDENIATGDFQVRKKALGGNPPSAWLSNTVAFTKKEGESPYVLLTTDRGLQNLQGTWKGSSVSAWADAGIATNFLLDENEDGYVYSYIRIFSLNDFILGFKTTNDSGPAEYAYSTIKFGYWVYSGELQKVNLGDPTPIGYTVPQNSFVGVFRESGVVTLRTSADSVNWTIKYTFSGLSTEPLFLMGNAAGTALYETAASKIDITGIRESQSYLFGKAYFSIGNSIADGIYGSEILTKSPGYLITQQYNSENEEKIHLHQRAVSGSTVQAMQTRIDAELSMIRSSHTKVVFSAIEGTNSFQVENPDVTFGRMMDIKNTVLAYNIKTRFILFPCINGNPTYVDEADRAIYNDLIYASTVNSRYKFIDIRGNSDFDSPTSYMNTSIYNADGVHLTDLGYQKLADLIYDQLYDFMND